MASAGVYTLNVSSVFRRSFRKDFPSAVRGEGAYVFDSNGQRYLDLSGSAAVNFIGHGVPEISAAMAEQAAQLEFVHTSQFTTPVAEAYAEELLAFAGPNFAGGAVYFTSGGSESIETALKLARQYQVEVGQSQRYQILSRTQSYHGSTLGALAVSGNKKRREIYLPMVREFAHIDIPYCYRCAFDCTDSCYHCGQQYAAELEEAIAGAGGAAAAFILEPISGATLGAVPPPPGYLEKIAEVCKNHDLTLIADEVMAGMGRVGRNFAVDHYQVAPDILVAAKGLSSGYAPLGAVIASKKVIDALAQGSGAFLHGFTYNAHPISLAAGRAVLAYLKMHDLVAKADSQKNGSPAHKLRKELDTLLDLPSVGDVRGLGLLLGVEFVADKKTKQPFAAEKTFASRVGQAAMKRGVLVYPMQGSVDGVEGDHLLVAPPAILTEEQISESVAQLRNAISEVARTV
jgi:adenosylmethionine-8-amino-7-oxononanoate aminotransferase